MRHFFSNFFYNFIYFFKTKPLNEKKLKYNKFLLLEPFKIYFFNLNKWAIDKAPKVSASSYLVGMGLIFLFHTYSMGNWEKFIYFSFSFFTINGYFIQFFFLVLMLLMFSYEKNSRIFFWMLVLPTTFILIYFFKYGVLKVVTNKFFFKYSTVVSFKFAVTWEFYLFILFLFGWIFKVGQKYSVESLTKPEIFLYKNILPMIYLFETVTLFYILAWRYINTTLVGYATVMYGRYYKQQEVTSFLITKIVFFNSCLFISILLLLLIKLQRETEFFIVFFIFILYNIFFLNKEFFEIWVFTHQTFPTNLSKFTYFKFLKFLLLFNYFHAYVVIIFSLVIFIKTFQKDNTIFNSYEFMYVIIKNFYFILSFIVLTFFSIYVITNLDFEYPSWMDMFYKLPIKKIHLFKTYSPTKCFATEAYGLFR